MSERIEYTCGFLFDHQMEDVVLIRKQHPEWQKGKLNGIGGRVEPGESPAETMRREAREEAGVDADDWRPLVSIEYRMATVHFFFLRCEHLFALAETRTKEKIEKRFVRGLSPNELVHNLRYILPLAEMAECERYEPIRITAGT